MENNTNNIFTFNAQDNVLDFVQNEYFFAPLIGPNRKIYYAALQELYHCKTTASLDSLSLDHSQMCRHLDIFFQHNHMRLTPEDGIPIKTPASYILSKLADWGWLTKKEKKGFKYVIDFTYPAIVVLNKLMEIPEKNNYRATQSVLAMDSIIKESRKPNSIYMQKPYSYIVQPLIKQKEAVVATLSAMQISAKEIMQKVKTAHTMNVLSQFITRDEIVNNFFQDYKEIKGNGHISSYIRDIREQIRDWENDETFIKRCVEDVPVQYTNFEIKKQLDNIFNFLSDNAKMEGSYQFFLADIERQINQYYKMLCLQIDAIMGNGQGAFDQMVQVLDNIKKIQNVEEQGRWYKRLGECFSLYRNQTVSMQSIKHYNRQKKDVKTKAVQFQPIDQKKAAQQTKERLNRAINRKWSRKGTQRYIEQHIPFNGKQKISTDEIPNLNREDILIMANAHLFGDDSTFPYRIHFDPKETFKTSFGEFSKMTIERKPKRIN